MGLESWEKRIKAVTRFDLVDLELVENDRWCLGGSGYTATIRYPGGRKTLMHRVIMSPPKGLQVDHINGDRLDNRRCNLRIVTATQNRANSVGFGRSGIKGVCQKKDYWVATISKSFSTKEEAVAQRRQWEKELHGEEYMLNM
jgi:hypothetical protein